MFRDSKSFSYLILFLIAVFWGLGFPLTKAGIAHVGPLTFIGLRFLLALAIFFVWKPKAFFEITRKELLVGAGIGACLGTGFGFQTYGLAETSSGKAGFLTNLLVILVPLLTYFFFKKTVQAKEICGAGLAVVGFAVMSLDPQSLSIARGDLLVTACALFFALQIVCIDRYATSLNAYRVNLAQMMVAAALCIIGAGVGESVNFSSFHHIWWPLIITAVTGTAFPFLGQIFAQKKVSPTAAALILSLESIFAVVFGFLLMSERLNLRESVGCTIVFFAVLIVLAPKKKIKSQSFDPLELKRAA